MTIKKFECQVVSARYAYKSLSSFLTPSLHSDIYSDLYTYLELRRNDHSILRPHPIHGAIPVASGDLLEVEIEVETNRVWRIVNKSKNWVYESEELSKKRMLSEE
ncbi:hypothetical protein KEJ26_04985 [Candidatus Bathyarchaeota archaeon]|nr:hypothetical protein [Candidatus Bathyarchaeota archaeon]